jgi:hypothetical protein
MRRGVVGYFTDISERIASMLKIRDMLSKQRASNVKCYGFSLSLLFYHEDGYGKLLRNFCELPNYTASHPRNQRDVFSKCKWNCAVTIRPPFMSSRVTVQSTERFAGVRGKVVTELLTWTGKPRLRLSPFQSCISVRSDTTNVSLPENKKCVVNYQIYKY